MKKTITTFLLLLMTVALIHATDYSREEFWGKLQQIKSNEEADALFKEYVPKVADNDFAWEMFTMWKARREIQADDLFKTMEADPEQASRIWYFNGMKLDSLVQRIEYARKRIDEDNDAFEAYALMFDTYTNYLFKKRLEALEQPDGPSAEELKALEDGFTDNKKMVRVRKWKDAGEHVSLCLKYMGYYGEYKHHHDDAYKFFKAAEEMGAGWVNPVHIAVQAVWLKKMEEARSYVEKFADKLIENNVVKPEMRPMVIDDVMLRTFIAGKGYDEAISMIQSKENYQKDAMAMFNMAVIHWKKGDKDKAFDDLGFAVDNGFDDVEILKKDPDFEGITTHSRWPEFEKKIKIQWEAGEVNRAKEAVAGKIDKPAAGWELKDPTGKTYKLSDYAGKKVVILDFWATWCGPCMQAMPALDKWCKTHKPENVEVFSINTWERQPEKAKKLFVDQKYAMHLLMDGSDVAKQYGVSGIPYICVIGKDGKIHFEMNGFAPDLEKNLTYWVNDLLK